MSADAIGDGAPKRVRPGGRTARQLLVDRVFGPFIVGKLLSASATWVQQIATAVLMFELTGSALMVGAASAALFVGPLVLAPWAGAVSDRYDRRRVLIVGRLISAVSMAALTAAIALAGVDDFGGPAALLGAVGLSGIGHSLSTPAMQALTPRLVPPEDLEQALAISSVAPSVGRALGPLAGSALLLWGGPGLAFGVTAASYFALIPILMAIATEPHRRPPGRPATWGGVQYLFQTPAAGRLVLALALMGFGADPVLTLSPPLAEAVGGGREAVGLFASVFGVGAMVFVVLFRRLRRVMSIRAAGCMGFVLAAVGLTLVGLIPSTLGVATGFFINGAGFMMATVAINAQVQQRVPDELRGRVMALWGVAFLGSRPIVAMVSGAIADLRSVTLAVLVCGGVVLAAAPLARARYSV